MEKLTDLKKLLYTACHFYELCLTRYCDQPHHLTSARRKEPYDTENIDHYSLLTIHSKTPFSHDSPLNRTAKRSLDWSFWGACWGYETGRTYECGQYSGSELDRHKEPRGCRSIDTCSPRDHGSLGLLLGLVWAVHPTSGWSVLPDLSTRFTDKQQSCLSE